jgi:hypothetical protein
MTSAARRHVAECLRRVRSARKRIRLGNCFLNARWLVMASARIRSRRRLRYVEGYIEQNGDGKKHRHGWCIIGGVVYDPTINLVRLSDASDHVGLSYYAYHPLRVFSHRNVLKWHRNPYWRVKSNPSMLELPADDDSLVGLSDRAANSCVGRRLRFPLRVAAFPCRQVK